MSWYHEIGIKYPLFQGGMAWASNPELVSTVSNSGGLGIIGSGGRTKKELRQLIHKTKSQTGQPFGVNLMLMDNNIEELIEVICEEKVPIVTTGAGSPKNFINHLINHHIKVFPVVPSKEIAQKMFRLPIAGIIVEGSEAGGHVGSETLKSLLNKIVPISPVPVIAAGGIYDNSGFLSVIQAGASGVQVGTAFLVAKECRISSIYKTLICESTTNSTTLIHTNHGHLIRVLKETNTSSSFQLSLKEAVERGNIIEGAFMAGVSSAFVNEEEAASNIINRIINNDL